MITTDLDSSYYKRVYSKGASHHVGWLTRNLLESDSPRNLILFPDDLTALLTQEQLNVRNHIRAELERLQARSGQGRLDTTKHLVNVIFDGDNPLFSPKNGITIAIYRFGLFLRWFLRRRTRIASLFIRGLDLVCGGESPPIRPISSIGF
jgi:hypothetical protein